jgi:hypothetical protein
MTCLKPSLAQIDAWSKYKHWDRTPLGLEPPFLISRALRWLWDGAEKRWNLRDCSEDQTLHREAEHDTPGVNRQPFVHTSIDRRMQGKRHKPATLRLIRPCNIKLSLTLRF